MNAAQLALLIEVMNTNGLNFPIEKCKLAYETLVALRVEWQRAVELEKASTDG